MHGWSVGDQARRQEMKWGVFFCKKSGKWGRFVKKCKMVGVFCLKSRKWGCFSKKVDLSSTQSALRTVSVFSILHFTYLGGA